MNDHQDVFPETITRQADDNVSPLTRRETAMSNRRRLTKADIIGGTALTRDHYVKHWDSYVTIRPLSEGEWQRVKQLTLRGMREVVSRDPETGKQVATTEVDYAEQNAGAAEAERVAVASGVLIDGERLTVDEVAELRPATVVEELAREIYLLSGIKLPSRAKSSDEDDEDESEVDITEDVDAFPEDA
jgi:hypothetical protein